ncbi:MAG: 1,2-phenylacetyl-CoA epoxidase subunit PaaC [Gammaproteobacteria bacterium]
MSTLPAPDPRLGALLNLGDNALILGQRLGETVTTGPELEEEMATANFALDYVGQARLFFSYAGDVENNGRDEDAFAFRRDSAAFRNVLLVELPNGDFAFNIARQFLYESFYLLQLQALASSSDQRLREIAARAEKEIRYHLRHQVNWMLRLGDGTQESHRRMQTAIDELWRYTGEMFVTGPDELAAVEQGVLPDPSTLIDDWHTAVSETLGKATLNVPDEQWMASGGKQGTHTEHLGYLLAEMQFLPRAYPDASW